jgi:hypothetical protein
MAHIMRFPVAEQRCFVVGILRLIYRVFETSGLIARQKQLR